MSAMRRGVGVSRAVDGIIITVILAAIAICVDLYFRSEAEMASAVAKRQAAADRLDELNLRVYKMEREVESLRNNPAAIEQFARERFGYVRAGDVVVKMPMDDLSKRVSGEDSPRDEGTRAANLTPRRSGSYTAGSRF